MESEYNKTENVSIDTNISFGEKSEDEKKLESNLNSNNTYFSDGAGSSTSSLCIPCRKLILKHLKWNN